jgi:hypothetical protein
MPAHTKSILTAKGFTNEVKFIQIAKILNKHKVIEKDEYF